MRRLALVLILVCLAWSAHAQNCGPLGRPLIGFSPTACPNSLNYAGANYAPPPYYSWNTHSWSIVNGTIQGAADGQYISFTAGTEPVTLSLTATDGSGCSYSESVTVQISEQVPVDIMSNPTVCPNGVEVAAAASPNAYSYSSYTWTIENGQILETYGSYVRFRAGAEGAVRLSVIATGSSPSCTGSGTLDIPIAPPEAYPYYMPNMCTNTTQTVGGDSYRFDTFSWSIEGGTIIGDANTAYITVQSGSTAGTIQLTMNASSTTSGCSISKTFPIAVNDRPPAPQITAPTEAVCNRALAEASVTNASDYESIYWDISGGYFENYQNVGSVIRFRPDIYWDDHITLTAHGYKNGCVTSSTVQVPVTPGGAIITPGSQVICPGSTITLTAPEAASYSWSTGETTRSITVGAAGYYTANVTYANGCQASGSVSVSHYSTTTPTITASGATTFCQGGNVTLTSSPASSYLWSTGETTQSITVAASGNYTVTTTNANGCSKTSAPTAVTVNPLPTPSITVTNQYESNSPSVSAFGLTGHSSKHEYCGSVNVNLGVSDAQSYTSFLWSTGATTPTINVTSAGTYSVTVTNANGCSASDSVTINVTPVPPPPTITASGELCANGSVTLTASAADSYVWSTGATTQSITVSEPGSYSVSVKVNGCNSPSSSINVVERSVGVTASGPTTFCEGSGVTLTATEGVSYLWSNGATSQSINVVSSGNYSATVTFADGCAMTTDPVAVTVHDIDVSIASDRTTACPNGSINFTSSITGSPAAAYQWHGSGGAPIPGATSPSLTLTPATGGYIYLRVTDANGCSATSEPVTITVNENPPVPTITANGSTAICPGSNVTLSAPAGYNYLWSNGSTAQSITVGEGNYHVTVSTAAGCSAMSATTAVTLKTTTSIAQPANKSVPRNQQTTLSVSASGTNLTYRWYQGTKGNTSTPLGTASSQVVGPWSKKGTHSFWVRVSGDCGVVDSNTITVTVTN